MPYQYRYHYNSKPIIPKRHSRRARALLVPAIVVLVAGIVVVSHYQSQVARMSALDAANHQAATRVPTQMQTQAASMINAIISRDSTDHIGVAIENVATGSVSTYGSTEPFEIASTEKVLSAITYLHLVEEGQLSLTQPIGSYTAAYQLQQMVNQSNNDSWYAINDALGGNSELQAYANSIGLQYQVDGNLMRPQDMAKLLTKLYSGQLLNSEHTSELLSYMQHTNDETMIPSVLPSGLTAYHKYGELDDSDSNGNSVLHDAAIITDSSSSYVIVIYTSGTSSEDARTTVVQRIARQALIVCGW